MFSLKKKAKYQDELLNARLLKAISDVKGGKSKRKAAKDNNVNRNTLHSKIKRNQHSFCKSGRKEVLNETNKSLLKSYLLDRGDMGWFHEIFFGFFTI